MEFLFFDLIGSGIKWLYFRIRYRDKEKRALAIAKLEEREYLSGIFLIIAVLFMLLIAGFLIMVAFVTLRDLFK